MAVLMTDFDNMYSMKLMCFFDVFVDTSSLCRVVLLC